MVSRAESLQKPRKALEEEKKKQAEASERKQAREAEAAKADQVFGNVGKKKKKDEL